MPSVGGCGGAVALAAQQVGPADDFPARRAIVPAWDNSALFLGISLDSTRRRGGHLARQLRSELDDLGLNRDLWLNDKLGSHAKFGSPSLDGMTALPIGGKGDKNESTVRTKLSTIIGFAI